LVSHYRTKLEHCEDELPFDVERFGLHGPMTYDDFIYAVTWSSE
jgi:hypothetical protein